jgi:tRNA (guanine37-N1)-methyltransferase
MKKIWIITLFPDYFNPLIQLGIVGAALRGKRGDGPSIELVQLRDYSGKEYKGVDDSPFGGGPGMVIRADVLKRALVEGVVQKGNYGDNFREKLTIIFPSPRGIKWNNVEAKKVSNFEKDLVFICGRYEGIDERFIERYIDLEFSLGDFVLSGGELPSMVFIDSLLRFKKGVLGNESGSGEESFEHGLLEFPQYTRPADFEGSLVPDILLSGHHKKIDEYRKAESLRITKKYRPDLIKEDK